MKSLLKTFSLILLSILSMMFLLDFLYTLGFKHGEPRNKIQYILQLEKQHYDLVFFGSSRTESSIDCELVEKITGKSCISFGMAGSSLGDALVLMKLAQYQGITFDHAFLQIDDNYNSTGNTDFVVSTLMPFKDNPVIQEKMKELPDGTLYSKVPFYRYMAFDKVIGIRELAASVLGRQATVDYENGFWGLEFNSELVPTSFSRSIVENNPEMEEIQTILKAQGTQFTIFTAPYCNKAETKEYMSSLTEKFPNLYNYISLFDNKQEFFADCGHLDTEGARAFTEIFMKDLQLNKQF